MNLGFKAPQKEDVKILDYKTDTNGSALYKIQWLKKGDLVTWEPLLSLRMYYTQIRQFQKQFRSRDADWSQVEISRPKVWEKVERDHSGLDRYLQKLHERKRMQKEDIKSTSQKSLINPEDRKYTFENQSPLKNQDKFQSSQEMNFSSNKQSRSKQMNASSESNKAGEKESCNQIGCSETQENSYWNYPESYEQRRMRKRQIIDKNEEGPKIINVKRKKPRMRPQMPKQIIAHKIVDVYHEGRDWWARVTTKDGSEEHILRDALKILQPTILLEYYESAFEEKLKNRKSL